MLKRLGDWSVRRLLLVGAGLVVLVAAVGFYRQWAAVRQTQAWFAGSFETVEPEARIYYAPPSYDLTAYASYRQRALPAAGDPFAPEPAADDPQWIDGAGRQALDAALSWGNEPDGVSQATTVLSLLSPTTYREARRPTRLQVTYPPEGAVFPPNLCQPRVEWEDPHNDLWQVAVGFGDGAAEWTGLVEETSWWVPAEFWEVIRRRAVEQPAWVQVKGLRRPADNGPAPRVQGSPKVHFRISRWPVDESVVYRLVVPPFNKRKTPDTFSRDLTSFDERPFLLAHGTYCYNCHAFSAKTGTSGRLSVQARYMSPGSALPVYLGIYDLDRQQGWKIKLPFEIQMSTFVSWSPDGRYLAMSANQQLVTFPPTVWETQYAGQPTSDLAVYDVEANSSALLPGAADPAMLEMMPCWSPDGQRLVYCSAPGGRHPAQTRYVLNEIPYTQGKGGTPRLIPGAGDEGHSHYFPRFSPDGRWLSFCRGDADYLIKSSSDIYLLPADLQGPARRLESNVDHAADSWHSWSSNSRWLIFASKRDDGIFARLYLTEIDDDGRASPAVRLPLRQEPLASFNLPEFTAQRPRVDEAVLFEVVRVEPEPRVVTSAAARP